MFLKKSLVFLALLPALRVAHAGITVGSCQTNKHSYTTISQAIAVAHAGETIDICPGIYAEQLTITRPLTLHGLSPSGQAGVTITAPAAGLQALPAGSGFFPQIYAYRAGYVAIHNIAVDGTGANIVTNSIVFDTSTACQVGFLKDFSGIYFSDTAGEVRDSSVSAHFANSATPDSPQIYPNCGSGIEFANRGEEGLVTDTVINNYGYTGISSTGPVRVLRDVLTGTSGPYQIGISVPKTGGVVLGNTVSGVQFIQSTGIQGGEDVEDNIVQGWLLGIVNASQVTHNTLVNNGIGITEPHLAERNLITSPPQYTDPACATGECQPSMTAKPSVGIEMQCMDASQIRSNDMVGLGVGIADLKKNNAALATNLYAEVATASTSCAGSSN